MLPQIELYDSTLRDGAQMQAISFSVSDKLKIVELLDDLGIDYIEGGWNGANPKDAEFFKKVKKLKLKNSKIITFGTTKKINSKDCNCDSIIQDLLFAETEIITLVAKSWDLHVVEALRTTLDHNLQIISESIEYLKNKGRKVFLDAEHFFDGYRANPEYNKKIIEIAFKSGAETIILCDTNGGSLPSFIAQTINELLRDFPKAKLGIHVHNDSGLALANSLIAVENGACQVQGTINGIGERCGNVDLISVICNLILKMNKKTSISPEKLKKITFVSQAINEICNLNSNPQQPFTGRTAFTHKGGLHASAMLRNALTYEHIDPKLIGNKSNILVSEQAGLSNILDFAKNKNIDLGINPEENAKKILKKIKEKEHLGYQYEEADASLVLLFLRELEQKPKYFELIDFRVFSLMNNLSEATIRIKVEESEFHVASLGVGPGHALDQALRKALTKYYTELNEFKLSDFKVRVVDSHVGTSAKTKVIVETVNSLGVKWNTIGVHENIICATFEAIEESLEYGLYMKDSSI